MLWANIMSTLSSPALPIFFCALKYSNNNQISAYCEAPESGADGRTRTGTARATAPSRRRVYQFHHIRKTISKGKTCHSCLPSAPAAGSAAAGTDGVSAAGAGADSPAGAAGITGTSGADGAGPCRICSTGGNGEKSSVTLLRTTVCPDR